MTGLSVIAQPGGVERGYAESATLFSTGSTTNVDVTGVTVTVTVRDRPIIVEAGDGWTKNSTAGTGGNMIFEIIRTDTSAVVAQAVMASGASNSPLAWTVRRRLSLAAGTYTFKLQVRVAGGTVNVNNLSSGWTWIQVTEV